LVDWFVSDAMFLSGPSSEGDKNSRLYDQLAQTPPDYQSLSAVQTVTGGKERSFVLAGLQPGTLYAIVVAAFADNVDGAASNTVYLQTSDDGQCVHLGLASSCRPTAKNLIPKIFTAPLKLLVPSFFRVSEFYWNKTVCT